jgi:hypothetical protein
MISVLSPSVTVSCWLHGSPRRSALALLAARSCAICGPCRTAFLRPLTLHVCLLCNVALLTPPLCLVNSLFAPADDGGHDGEVPQVQADDRPQQGPKRERIRSRCPLSFVGRFNLEVFLIGRRIYTMSKCAPSTCLCALTLVCTRRKVCCALSM